MNELLPKHLNNRWIIRSEPQRPMNTGIPEQLVSASVGFDSGVFPTEPLVDTTVAYQRPREIRVLTSDEVKLEALRQELAEARMINQIEMDRTKDMYAAMGKTPQEIESRLAPASPERIQQLLYEARYNDTPIMLKFESFMMKIDSWITHGVAFVRNFSSSKRIGSTSA